MTRQNKALSLMFLAALVLTVGVVAVYRQKKGVVVPPASPPAATSKQPSLVPTQMEQIPFDYEVLAVSPSQATLKGEKGEAMLPNDSKVKVFRGVPGQATPADFTALAVGQKVRIERTLAAGVQEVRVYIIP